MKKILPTQVQALKPACMILHLRWWESKCNCLQGQTKAMMTSVRVADRVNTKIATTIRAELSDGLDIFFPLCQFYLFTLHASLPLIFVSA